MTVYAPQTTDETAPAWARTGSHRAGALDALAAAIDAHWPHRDHTSDGFLADARHMAEASASDHNPWLGHCVRAGDFDADGIDAAWLAENLRLLGAFRDRRLAGGGYVIFDHRITTPDFSSWVPYTAGDPHTSHVHVSLSRDQAGYEDRGPWAFLSSVAPQPPHPSPGPAPAPAPVPAPVVTPTGHDATGHGAGYTAHLGDAGQQVAELQHDLNTYAPAYSHLAEDGQYGHETAAVVAEFDHREARESDTPAGDRAGLAESNGEDFGPRSARAFVRDGLRL